MITKAEGAKDTCPSCQQELICRMKVSEKYGNSLQWQYADREEAHFSYDFKTKKSSCKEMDGSTSKAVTQSSSVENIDLDKLKLPGDQVAQINNESADLAERMVVAYNTVKSVCNRVGITHPATIGMIFNQVCETRRS
jgi:hypothetical protein